MANENMNRNEITLKIGSFLRTIQARTGGSIEEGDSIAATADGGVYHSDPFAPDTITMTALLPTELFNALMEAYGAQAMTPPSQRALTHVSYNFYNGHSKVTTNYQHVVISGRPAETIEQLGGELAYTLTFSCGLQVSKKKEDIVK
jgi:hypothetical protein